MECRATKDGYFNRIIKRGEKVGWPKNNIPSWLEPVDNGITIVDEEVKETKPKETKEKKVVSDELVALREKAKALGYTRASNAGVEKCKAFIEEAEFKAEVEAEAEAENE